MSQPSVVHVGLGSTLLYCTFLSLLCGQCGLSHSCTVPLFLIPAPPRCEFVHLSLSLSRTVNMVSSTPAQPPLPAPPSTPPGHPGPAPSLSPQAPVGKGSAVPARPSPAQPSCPRLRGQGAGGGLSGAIELRLRPGWTCWRCPGSPAVRTAGRCGVGLGGLSDTRAPPRAG